MGCVNCGTEVHECACCNSWVHERSGLTVCESSAVAAHLGIAEWAGPWTAYPAMDRVK